MFVFHFGNPWSFNFHRIWGIKKIILSILNLFLDKLFVVTFETKLVWTEAKTF